MDAYRVTEKLFSIELLRNELINDRERTSNVCYLQEPSSKNGKSYEVNKEFNVFLVFDTDLRKGVLIKSTSKSLDIRLSNNSIQEILKNGVITEELDSRIYAVKIK